MQLTCPAKIGMGAGPSGLKKLDTASVNPPTRPPILDPRTYPDENVIKLVTSILGAQLRTKAMDIDVADRIAINDISMLFGRDCLRSVTS